MSIISEVNFAVQKLWENLYIIYWLNHVLKTFAYKCIYVAKKSVIFIINKLTTILMYNHKTIRVHYIKEYLFHNIYKLNNLFKILYTLKTILINN